MREVRTITLLTPVSSHHGRPTVTRDAVFLMGIDAPTAMKVFDPRSVLRRFEMRTSAVRCGRRGAMRLEVALGHAVEVRDEEWNHAEGSDKERHDDEQQTSQPFHG
jgi:hypothetical protein